MRCARMGTGGPGRRKRCMTTQETHTTNHTAHLTRGASASSPARLAPRRARGPVSGPSRAATQHTHATTPAKAQGARQIERHRAPYVSLSAPATTRTCCCPRQAARAETTHPVVTSRSRTARPPDRAAAKRELSPWRGCGAARLTDTSRLRISSIDISPSLLPSYLLKISSIWCCKLGLRSLKAWDSLGGSVYAAAHGSNRGLSARLGARAAGG